MLRADVRVQLMKTLLEAEAVWTVAWARGVEAAKAGLSAPLLVRGPDGRSLLVNLDRGVMDLIRWVLLPQGAGTGAGVCVCEGGCGLLLTCGAFRACHSSPCARSSRPVPATNSLQRGQGADADGRRGARGCARPHAAGGEVQVLLWPAQPCGGWLLAARGGMAGGAGQHNCRTVLSILPRTFLAPAAPRLIAVDGLAQVRSYESCLSCIASVLRPLLRPHLEDMERKVAPGLFVLTWTSINIDGYLHRFKQVC